MPPKRTKAVLSKPVAKAAKKASTVPSASAPARAQLGRTKAMRRRRSEEKEILEPEPVKAIPNGHPAKASPVPSKAKKAKVVPVEKVKASYARKPGVVLTLGQGDTGQLGLGEDIMERAKPAWVKSLEGIVAVCAGGMHSIAVDKNGQVYTFGCNDEGALGRITEDDDECYTPGKVILPGKVVQVSAGDSHSVALTEDGKAFFWGNFRDSSGPFGLTTNGAEKLPVPLAPKLDIKKVASGSDHIALLTRSGEMYTLGCAEQGQLGRVSEHLCQRGGRRGLSLLLQPERVRAKNRRISFKNLWAGSYGTYALTTDDDVLVCGLNNYRQLGVKGSNTFHTLVKSTSFSEISQERGWNQIVPGQHHALALDGRGNVYAIGRVEYGRLGMGEDLKEDADTPTAVPALKGKHIVDVACGTAVSFAVEDSGEVYSWGMGTNGQLGLADDEDSWTPEPMLGKQLEDRDGMAVSGGGQHTIVLAADK